MCVVPKRVVGLAMRHFFRIALLAVVCHCLHCFAAPPVEIPPGWTTVDSQKFKFSIPPDLKEVSIRGIDSFVGQYKGTNLSLSFDYGDYSDPLIHCQGAAHVEEIDGKTAKIVTECYSRRGDSPRHGIGVHFPKLGRDTKLTVLVECNSTNDFETAKTIFRTIRFK
jgi:hypothetical protein